MIILSQDGKEIINFDNVNLIRVQDDGSIVTYDNNYNEQTGVSSVLGEYETEERAKEILQEIINAYLDCNVQNVSAKYAYVKNIVFEMPTE